MPMASVKKVETHQQTGLSSRRWCYAHFCYFKGKQNLLFQPSGKTMVCEWVRKPAERIMAVSPAQLQASLQVLFMFLIERA